jgi:hypothetical protein
MSKSLVVPPTLIGTVPDLVKTALGEAWAPLFPLPELLYHYTSAEALLAILSNGTLWATDLFFLNDKRELSHALEVLAEIFDEERKAGEKAGDSCASIERFATMLGNHMSDLSRYEVYVTSFSRHGNLLSQWRGYCPSAGGYSIGFETARIGALAQANGFFAGPCIYDSDMQRHVLRAIVRSVFDSLIKNVSTSQVGSDHAVSEHLHYYRWLVETYAPFMKNPAFDEESEWRVVSVDYTKMDDGRYRTRPARGLLVPYYEFSLTRDGGPVPVKEIWIGPQAEQQVAARGVGRFRAMTPHLEGVEVKRSKIPYRAP